MSSVEALFRPNNTLVQTVLQGMREQGHRLGERFYMSVRLRMLSPAKKQELELKVTERLLQDVNAGLVTLPVSASVVEGVLVGDWRDLFQWFFDNWESILEIIMFIISLF